MASVIQTAIINQSGSSWSGSFGSNVTAGSAVALLATGANSTTAMSSSAPTFNGSSVAGSFQMWSQNEGASSVAYSTGWLMPNVAGGSAAVGLTVTNGSNFGSGATGTWGVEVAGMGASPTAVTPNSAGGSSAAWNSGATGSATGPGIAFGCCVGFGQTVTQSGGGWTNLTQMSSDFGIAGYQLVSSGTVTYSGTLSTGNWAVGATIVLATPAAPQSAVCPPALPPGRNSPMAFQRMRAPVAAPTPPVVNATVTTTVLSGSVSFPAPGVSQTYYVSPSGSDGANGTSTGTPWQTIAKVNAATLAPGSAVFFQGGQTWSGSMLAPTSPGTAAAPITIGSYGTGNAVISNGTNEAIYIYNVGGYVIENLNVTGISGSASYSGIEFYAFGAGQLPAITIQNCQIAGWQYGILIGGSGATDGWNGITLSGDDTSGNIYSGVLTYGAAFNPSSPAYNHQSVLVENCTANNNTGVNGVSQWTGSGIVLGSVNGGTITGCTAHGNGADNTYSAGPVGIWTYASNNVTIEYCLAYSNATGSTGDGDGFDLDIDCTNCVIQYCLAYSNAGAGILCWGGTADTYWGSAGGNVVRWNLCWGNGTNGASNSNYYGEITLGGNLTGLQVYGNTCVSRTAGSAQPAPFANPTANTLSGVTVRNNIFYCGSTDDLIVAASAYTTGQLLLQGNCYYSTGTLGIYWGGTTYASLAAFQAGQSGQEKVSGSAVGLQANPLLAAPATAPTVTSPLNLSGASGLVPQYGSPCIGAGLNLSSLFGVNYGTQDFYGNTLSLPLPVGGAEAVTAAVTTSPLPCSAAFPAPAPSVSATVTTAVLSGSASFPSPAPRAGDVVTTTLLPGSATFPVLVVRADELLATTVLAGTIALPPPSVGAGETVPASALPGSASFAAPGVHAGETIATTVLAGSSAWPAPAFRADETVTAAALNGSAAFAAPGVSAGAALTAAALSGTAAFPAPAVTAGVTLTPAALACTAAFPGTTIRAGDGVTTVTLPGSAGFAAPTIAAGSSATAATTVLNGSAAFPAPGIRSDANLTGTALTGSASFPAAGLRTDASIASTLLAGSAVFPAVTVNAGETIAAAALTGTAAFPGPAIGAGSGAAPGALTGGASFPAAAVAAGSGVAVTALTGSAAFPAPGVSAGSGAAPAVLAGSAVFPAESFRADANLTASLLSGAAAFPVPSISAGGSATVAPAVLAGSSAFPAPVTRASETASAAALTAGASFPAPTAAAGSGLIPAALAVSAGFPAPQARAGSAVIPADVAGAVSFPAPSVSAGSGTTITPATLPVSAAFPSAAPGAGATVPAEALAGVAVFPSAMPSAGSAALPPAFAGTAGFPPPAAAAGAVVIPAAVAGTAAFPAPDVTAAGGVAVSFTIITARHLWSAGTARRLWGAAPSRQSWSAGSPRRLWGTAAARRLWTARSARNS